MGLLDSFTDPTTLGLLSTGAGLLSASGPSRMPVSTGQALAAGLNQGMAGYRQGMADQMQLLQMQQAMRRNQMINDALSQAMQKNQGYQDDSPSSAPQPDNTQLALATGAQQGSIGPTQDNAQRLGTLNQQPPQPVPAQPMSTPASGLFGLPQNVALPALMSNDPFGELTKASLAFNTPTDFVKQLRAAGIDPSSAIGHQLLQDNLYKQNYIANESFRPGGYMRDPRTGQLTQLPKVPEGFSAQIGQDGQFHIVPVQGGVDAVQTNSAAKGAPMKVWNAAKGQYEYQTALNVTNAANGTNSAPSGAPVTTNPAWSKIDGTPSPYDPLINAAAQKYGFDPAAFRRLGITESGLNPLAINSQDGNGGSFGLYQINGGNFNGLSKQDIMKPAVNIDRAAQIWSNALQQAGGDPNRAVAIYKGASSQNGLAKIAPAAQFITGTPPQGGQPSAGGPMAADAPMGLQSNLDAAQKNNANTMRNSYTALQAARAGGGAALQDINHMMDLGNSKLSITAGPLVGVAKIFSSNAAEYEKSRDNLVTQLSGQLGMNTDYARALVYGSIPAYGAPKQAIQNGLSNLRDQVQLRMLKANMLTPYFNRNDSQGYNQFENAFDQNVTPAMVPLLTMPPGANRATALQQTLQKNPQMRPMLEWAVQNGVLK